MKRVLAVFVLSAPFAGSAADLSHTYVEGGVARLEADAPAGVRDPGYTGGYLKGSAALNDRFYVFGGHQQVASDDFDNVDVKRSNLGVGYNHALNERVELLAELGYARHAIEDYSTDAARVSAGVRGQLGERVEGWAKASYTGDETFLDGRYSAQVGAMLKLNPTWGITGEVDAARNANVLTLGVRAGF